RVARSTAPAGLVAATSAMLAKAPADRPDATTLLKILHAVERDPERDPSRRRFSSRTVAVALGAVAIASIGLVLARPKPVLDPNSVVVFPFTESTPAASGAGEAVATLIGSALEHTEPLRWVNGWDVFETWTDAGRGISVREGDRITRRMGARYYLHGAIVAYGVDSVSVSVRLRDVLLDSTWTRSVSGTIHTETVQAAATLAQRAIVPLLGVLTGPSHHVELTYLKDRRPGAIALWLQGEREMRSANFGAALDSYRRALSVDSTLAVAALTAAGVAIWTNEYPGADSLVRLALRHSEGLPPRNLAFAEGMVDFLASRGDSAVSHFRAAIEADSMWSPAWMMLGDSYHHLITGQSPQDSLAEAAFARSVELDPGFGPALFHLAEAVLRRGDLRAGERLLRRFRDASKESTLASQLEMMLTCARRGPGAVNWQGALPDSPLRLLGVASNFGAGAIRLDCAEAAARAVFENSSPEVAMEVRWAAFKWLHHLAVARGDLVGARALIDTATRAVGYVAQTLLVLDAIFADADSQAAMPMLEAYASSPEEPEIEWLWYLGHWAYHQHDTARLDSIVSRLEDMSARESQAATVAASFAARRSLQRGDTAGAIAQLEVLRPTSELSELQWGLWQPLAAEQMLLARLLLATGQADAAFTAAARMDGVQSNIYLYFLPGSLVIRMLAAEQLGRGATAELMRERLRNLGRTDLLQAGTVH
ncbi:MAG TPA: hypothetical protein PLL69_09305, partial [Gemmatimonadales bacterium]|nr:hypothetical protein [Gemmatimonadales bacterium]